MSAGHYPDSGGMAFPGPAQHELRVDINEGMTLRDWFAGMALASRASGSYNAWEDLADDCYKTADAMIARRKS